MSHFYSHLIKVEPVLLKLEQLELSQEQKLHLTSLVDSTVHQTVLDLVLVKLDTEDKERFISMLEQEIEMEMLWEFINTKVDNAKEQIYHTIDQLIREFIEDIEESKTTHE